MKKSIIVAMMCMALVTGGCATMNGDIRLVTELAVERVFMQNPAIAGKVHGLMDGAIEAINLNLITTVEELEAYLVSQINIPGTTRAERKLMTRVVGSSMEDLRAKIAELGLSGVGEIQDQMIIVLEYIDEMAVYYIEG